MHARFVLACTGSYLSQIGSDQKGEGIYGIRRTYRTSLCTWLGRIGIIKISKESGGHASQDSNVCSCGLILMFMQTIFWCTWAHIFAKLGQLRKMNVSMESGEHVGHFWVDHWFKYISQQACALQSCVNGPITQPNWVRSERLKYLWNQGNMWDISEQTVSSKHIHQYAYTL